MLSPKTIANISTGTKDSIGPVPMPSRPAPCPSWKIRVTKPSAAPIDSRFRIAALIGMITERNTSSSSSALNSTTTPTKSGSLLGHHAREVLVGGREAADLDPRAGLALDRGHDVVAQALERVGRRRLLRAGPRVGGDRRHRAVGRDRRRRDEGEVLVGAHRVGDLLRRRLVALLRQLGDEQERAVGAGAEALGDQVVGLARRRARADRRPRRWSPGACWVAGSARASSTTSATVAASHGRRWTACDQRSQPRPRRACARGWPRAGRATRARAAEAGAWCPRSGSRRARRTRAARRR